MKRNICTIISLLLFVSSCSSKETISDGASVGVASNKETPTTVVESEKEEITTISDYSIFEIGGVTLEAPTEWVENAVEVQNDGDLRYRFIPSADNEREQWFNITNRMVTAPYADTDFDHIIDLLKSDIEADGGKNIVVSDNPNTESLSKQISFQLPLNDGEYDTIVTVYRGGPQNVCTVSSYTNTSSKKDYSEIYNHMLKSVVPGKDYFEMGETWVAQGFMSLRINGVSETDDRNPYSEVNPEAVYIVDYEYENLGKKEGLFISLDDEQIIDSDRRMGFSYPGDRTLYPQTTPVGAICDAQGVIGVQTKGDFFVIVSEYDDNFVEYSAKFRVDVEGE